MFTDSGASASVNSCLDVLSHTMETFARVMPAAALGIFNRVSMLANFPSHFIWIRIVISRVSFPGNARFPHEPSTLAAVFRRTQPGRGTLSVADPLA